MNWGDIRSGLEYLFLYYFIILNIFYIMLNVLSSITIRQYLNTHDREILPAQLSYVSIPISLIVPAYNEEKTIIESINALRQLRYQKFEIIVVNDGSTDNTLEKIIDAFDMKALPVAYRQRLPVKKIRAIYKSQKFSNIRLIDKDNGGKSDSLNAAINDSRYPLFCAIDADSILQPDSLDLIIQPFMEDPSVVATGGIIRISNGCRVRHGHLIEALPPKNWLALLQVMEYIRAFIFGRLGWSPMNALLIVSGAFGVFHKETVISVGGYKVDTIGEDMELIVRLHRILSQRKRKYRISFVPDPICWTQAPEDFTTLANQRIRWQQGLAESLSKNFSLMFHPRGGAAGFLAFPFMFIFEFMGPFIEFAGYLYFILGFTLNFVDTETMLIFLTVSIGFGIFISVIALFLEETSYRAYTHPSTLFKLFLAAVIENFGYRQLNTWWRFKGMLRWATGQKGKWGEMKRQERNSAEY